MDILKFKNVLQKFKIPYCNFEELPPLPIGNYVAVKVHKNLAYISGQFPFIDKEKLYPYKNEYKKDEISYVFIFF